MNQVVNLSGAASIFHVAPQTIRAWIGGGCPVISAPGANRKLGYKIDLSAMIDWRITQERKKTLQADATVDVEDARRRKADAIAGLAELELAEKQNQVVSFEDIGEAFGAVIGASRTRLLGLGARLGPELALEQSPSRCQHTIDDAIREALTELSEFSLSGTGSGENGSRALRPEADEPVGTSAKADGKRVGGRRKASGAGVRRGARKVADK